MRQARRQVVVLQDRAVLQRTPCLLEPGNVSRSSCSPVSPAPRSFPGGTAVGRRGAAVDAFAVPRCASYEACEVGDEMPALRSSPGGTAVGRRGAAVAALAVSQCASQEACEVGDEMLKRSKAVEGADETYAAVWTATAGERERIIRLHEVTESDFPPLLCSSQSPNSCPGSWSSACARSVARRVATAPARVCPGSSFSAVSAAVAHAHASVLHGASVNSWSDTVRLHGPTGTRRVKGGVSRPAEDLRPVSEVEAGVNFRPAGRVRGQVAGSLPGRQPGAGSRPNKGSVVTPSLHPEVPDSLSVSPGPGKRIRQLMGWTKVCETALSGIWVL